MNRVILAFAAAGCSSITPAWSRYSSTGFRRSETVRCNWTRSSRSRDADQPASRRLAHCVDASHPRSLRSARLSRRALDSIVILDSSSLDGNKSKITIIEIM